MRRAALTAVLVLCGCPDDKDPLSTASITAAPTGDPTSSTGSTDPTGGEETGSEPTAGAGPFDPKILYVAGGAGPEARASWMNPDGSDPLPVASGMGPEYPVMWSRSGANVLFGRGSDIWRVIPESGEEFNVTNTPDAISGLLDVSPDGTWVLFASIRDGVVGLYRVRMTGGEAEPLVTTDDPYARYEARYSPDGLKIAYVAGSMVAESRLFISDALGNGAIEVVGVVPQQAPTWSPDGTRLAVGGYLGDETSAIFTFTPAGAELKSITAGENALFARWSPDGSRIAFYGTTPEHGSGWIIGVVDPDGANQTFLTEDYATCYLPDWSPDGTTLVFGCSDDEKGTGIYTMVVDGGTPTMILAEPNHSWYPKWRP
jgi:Tol biopolymer transport system component